VEHDLGNKRLSRPYRVIQLSTSYKGGAALASRRLNKSLNSIGVDSEFISISKTEFALEPHESKIERGTIETMFGYSFSIFSKFISHKTPFSLFGTNLIDIGQGTKFRLSGNTIVHVHNWFNLISHLQVINLALANIPVVVTLHDQRFFTGGCHNSYECEKFVNSCESCPKLPKIFKTIPNFNHLKVSELLNTRVNNLKFIAPSKWMLAQAKKSSLLKNQDVRFIPNTLGDFSSIPMDQSIKKFGKLKVGVASVDKNSYLKGGDILKEIQGKIENSQLKIELIFLSDVLKQQDMNAFWGNIDVLLVPSRAENSPNVIHEAKSLGIPVLASDVGGISELLHPSYDHLISMKDLNADYILQHLLGIKPYLSKKNREEIKKRFRSYSHNSISQHTELYQEVIDCVKVNT
jgi:glycosyltransferase involved in cell wall biosynthesis